MTRLPSRVKKFLVRKPERSAGYAGTWEFFIGRYGEAFQLLADAALRGSSTGISPPLFFLCRHSMELSIKWAIVEYAQSADEEPAIAGHGLMQLWRELLRQLAKAGFHGPDQWTDYCGKLVQHIHEIDPDGERFRYPMNRAGVSFGYTEGDLRDLAVAQWHIGVFCDAVGEMLQSLGRQDPAV